MKADRYQAAFGQPDGSVEHGPAVRLVFDSGMVITVTPDEWDEFVAAGPAMTQQLPETEWR